MKKDSNLQRGGFYANVPIEARAQNPDLYLDPDAPYGHVYGLSHALARVRFEQNSKFYDHEGKLVEIVTEI